MKQLKILFFCVGTLLNGFMLYPQTGDNDKLVLKLPEYEIKNPVIYSLLDSLDMLSEECIFCLLNKPYFYYFSLRNEKDSTIKIVAKVEQQYGSSSLTYSLKAKNKGFFYHNDILVIVRSDSSIDEFFVLKNDSLRNIYYKKNITFIPTYLKSVDGASLVYHYSKGDLNEYGIKVECHKSCYFIWKIEKSDTWEFLLNECKCTEEMLYYVDGKYVGELPKVGDELIIEYNLTNNKEVTMNRISLETVFPEIKRIRFLNNLNRITPIYQNGFYIGILF